DEIREEGQVLAAALQAIRLSHLGVSETVRGVGKLERDRDRAGGLEEPRSILQQFPSAFLADRRRQEVEEHGPLVMPGQSATRLGHKICLRDAVLTQSVDEAVVRL